MGVKLHFGFLRNWLGRIRVSYWIAALAVVLVLFDTFIKPISAISLGLLVLAVAVLTPWWRQVPSLIKSAELPGGLKVEFRDDLRSATQEAQQAGLLSEPQPEKKEQPIYELIYNDDPTLSLAGLRIAIERRLRDLAKIAGVSQAAPLSRLATNLESAQVLTHEQAGALRDLLPLLNKALHSEEYSKEAADWAITFGPKLLAGLDERAVAAGGKPDQLWGSSVALTATGSSVGSAELGSPNLHVTQRSD
jgi:hypothetical protein